MANKLSSSYAPTPSQTDYHVSTTNPPRAGPRGRRPRRAVTRTPRRLPSAAQAHVIELKLFLREPMTIVFTFAFPVVLMFVLGEVFGNQKGTSNEHVFGNIGAISLGKVRSWCGISTGRSSIPKSTR